MAHLGDRTRFIVDFGGGRLVSGYWSGGQPRDCAACDRSLAGLPIIQGAGTPTDSPANATLFCCHACRIEWERRNQRR